MKTDNIYIAQLASSTRIEHHGTLEDYYFGKGIYKKVYHQPIKYVIVKKVSQYKAIDLLTKKNYLCDLPCDSGVLYLPPSKMLQFDAIYPEEKSNLSKKKILTLGKQAIKEFEKIENEQKNK